MISPYFFALIPAAGIGERSGAAVPKQYLPLAGRAMLRHVLDTFAASPIITHTFVVVSVDDGYIDQAAAGVPCCSILREGGATRCESVLKGLIAMREQVRDQDWILVHDAARPGLGIGMIGKLVAGLCDDAVGGLLALPIVDTLKRAGDNSRVQDTVSRTALWAAQTPQMFRYGLLRRALEQAPETTTDEAGAIEALGLEPKLIEGSARNFKVTMPQDFALAELYLKGLA